MNAQKLIKAVATILVAVFVGIGVHASAKKLDKSTWLRVWADKVEETIPQLPQAYQFVQAVFTPNPTEDCQIYLANHTSGINSKIYTLTPNVEGGQARTTFFADLPFTDAHIALTLDGSKLFAVKGFDNNEIGYLDIATKTYHKLGELYLGKITQASFDPYGRLFLATNNTNKIYVIEDLENVTPIDWGKITFEGKVLNISGADLAFSAEGEFFLSSASYNGQIFKITGTQGDLQAAPLGAARDQHLTGLAVLDNGQGNLIYSGQNKREVAIINRESGDLVTKLNLVGDLTRTNFGDMSTACMPINTNKPPVGGCTAAEVVAFSQGLTNRGRAVAADRSDPSRALGQPIGGDAKNSFVSLGFGGHIVLKFEQAIINGPGNDILVVETSFGAPTCNKYPEKVEAFASQDGQNFVSLGIGCLDSEFDLGDLEWAQYIKLVDVSNPADFRGEVDGYDLDGVVCLNGSMPVPPPADDEDPILPIACEDIQINRDAQGNISITNVHPEREAYVAYSLYQQNAAEPFETNFILVEPNTTVYFEGVIPAKGKVVFNMGAEDLEESYTGEACVVKTGTKVIEVGTRIEQYEVFEDRVYDARSWNWFVPKERQVLRDLNGNTVQETDKGVSLRDLTVGTNETNLRVELQTREMGYTHAVGVFFIGEDGLPHSPRILTPSIAARSYLDTFIPGTIAKDTRMGFFLVATNASQNPIVQNPTAQVRFQGTTLQYSTDEGATWINISQNIFVSTIREWNKNNTEQAIAGIEKNDEGKDVLHIGFEDIAGGGDWDYEDIVIIVHYTGVSHLKTKEVKETKEVDVLVQIPCGSCSVSFDGAGANDPEPLSCDVVDYTQDGEEVTLTNTAEFPVIVSYGAETVMLDAAETKVLNIPIVEGQQLVFNVKYRDMLPVVDEDRCVVKVGTKTVTTSSQVPILVKVNDKVYDARNWDIFDLAERKFVSFVGGMQLNPLDYGVSLADLTTITDEVNLRVDGRVGGVSSTNVAGWFVFDAQGQPTNPEVLFVADRNRTTTLNSVVPKGTRIGFFVISYKDKSLYKANDLKYLRFVPNTGKLQRSADNDNWTDVENGSRAIQIQYTLAQYNQYGKEMAIAGVEEVNGRDVLNIGFENNYYDDWDYEDVILTVHFSPEMVYKTKTVTETREVDLFAETPCDGCSFVLEGTVAPVLLGNVTCADVKITKDSDGNIIIDNTSPITAIVEYDAPPSGGDDGGNVPLSISQPTVIEVPPLSYLVLSDRVPANGQITFYVFFPGATENEGVCTLEQANAQGKIVTYTVPCEPCQITLYGDFDDHSPLDLTLAMTLSASRVAIGNPVTLTVSAQSLEGDGENVTVDLTLPYGLQVGAVNGAAYNNGMLEFGALPAGTTQTATLVLVPQIEGYYAIAGMIASSAHEIDMSNNAAMLQLEAYVNGNGGDNTESVVKNVYPNPFSTQLNVAFEQPVHNEVSIRLINSFGAVVYSKVQVLKGESNINIATAQFPNGFYHLEVLVSGQQPQIFRLAKFE
ncbi:DUF4114 domain-containing protein [Eisenibacter elegans]|uniref:DUF4114 domain-containing protein n=1 Tax=Eisenibacter elegans TaxID=997 RepID=UPI000404E4DC|nr:DUF4114 domain-containing protein [Eisenibacter elegans]